MSKRLTVKEKNGIQIKELLESGKEVVFNFKWSISKGYYTYGYNICTCKANNLKVGQCNGGGYDMQGVSLASFFNLNYGEDLRKINTTGYINGACGLAYVLRVIEKLGFNIKYDYKKNGCDYIISKNN